MLKILKQRLEQTWKIMLITWHTYLYF